MSVPYEDVEAFVRDEVAALTSTPVESVTPDSVLVGPGRIVDSADLVMLLLSAEEFARERLGAEFDWTSDSAMSATRSVLRSVETLARHLSNLQEA